VVFIFLLPLASSVAQLNHKNNTKIVMLFHTIVQKSHHQQIQTEQKIPKISFSSHSPKPQNYVIKPEHSPLVIPSEIYYSKKKSDHADRPFNNMKEE